MPPKSHGGLQSYEQTDALTPKIVASCCVRVGSDVQTDGTTLKMLGPAVHCGKDTTHKTLETMGIARAWPQQCSGRTVQTDPTFSRYASAITEQKKCCELLANKVAYFFTGLKSLRYI